MTAAVISTAAPDSGPAPMISIEALTVRFGDTVVLRSVTEAVGAGEWLAVIGANGAGKSTLLRAVAGFEAHEGTIRVQQKAMAFLGPRRRARLVAYLPQALQLPADMATIDYVLLGRTAHIGYFGVESAHDRAVCCELLDQLGLARLAKRRLSSLSGGEQHRVALCRALAQEAPVLLLDEPTSDLDLGRRVEALELIDAQRRERRITVVSAMHDLTLAAQFAGRVLLLSGGSVVCSGRPAQVLIEDLLSDHFGGPVRVVPTADDDLLVGPRRQGTGRPRDEALVAVDGSARQYGTERDAHGQGREDDPVHGGEATAADGVPRRPGEEDECHDQRGAPGVEHARHA
ncbi:MAG: ABC transporter ATP-binding protein [Acidimicrobiales bacterium]